MGYGNDMLEAVTAYMDIKSHPFTFTLKKTTKEETCSPATNQTRYKYK
jgi:hypothetical protein